MPPGKIYLTSTGFGHEVKSFVWFTEELGLALGSLGDSVYRTTDGGGTWSAIPLPKGVAIMMAGHVGPVVWAYDVGGELVRSHDAGLTWEIAPQTPFDMHHPCAEIWFANARSGWARGRDGKVWRTTSAGATWTPSSRPRGRGFGSWFLWLSSDAAVFADGGEPEHVYATEDGGASWRDLGPLAVDLDANLYVSHLRIGENVRTVFGTRPLASLADALRAPPAILSGDLEAWGPDGVVAASGVPDTQLRFFEHGRLVRAGPLLTPGSGHKERLLGMGTLPLRQRWGWTERQIYRSDDDGMSWYAIGDCPPHVRVVAFENERDGIAEADGAILRSEDGGRTWEPSPSPGIDRRSLARFDVRAGREPAPPSPVLAVESSIAGALTVTFGTHGCFGGTESTVRIQWKRTAGTIGGGKARSRPSRSAEVLPEEAKRMAATILGAAERAEVHSSCASEGDTFAMLDWWLTEPNGNRLAEKARLSTDDCGDRTLDGRAAYSRANAIQSLAQRALSAEPP